MYSRFGADRTRRVLGGRRAGDGSRFEAAIEPVMSSACVKARRKEMKSKTGRIIADEGRQRNVSPEMRRVIVFMSTVSLLFKRFHVNDPDRLYCAS